MSSGTGDRTILITGAGRGLGRALARLYAEDGWRVIACARRPVDHGEGRHLDVSDPASIAALGASLAGEAIDVVVNNAAVRGDTGGLDTLTPEDFSEVMRVNALAPLLVARALHANLMAGRRRLLVNIGSRAGSLAEGVIDDDDGDYAYRLSKAAMNMATVLLARDWKTDGIAVLSLHPGWVQTDMGGAEATLPVETSAAGLKRVIDGAGTGDSGGFRAYDGAAIRW